VLPPPDDWNGIIRGFKLLYKQNGSSGQQTVILLESESIQTKVVSGLEEYTKYDFQVLAYTSAGDGPKSSVKSVRTLEDGKK